MRQFSVKLFAAGIALACIAVSAPEAASAEHRSLQVELQSLSVQAEDGMLVVDYHVGGDGLRRSTRHSAGLAFRVRGLYRSTGKTTGWHRGTFASPRGTVRIPWGAGSQLPPHLQIHLVASAPHTHVRHLRYRGHHHAGLHLHRHDDHHYRHPRSEDWGRDLDLEEALASSIVEQCDRHAHGASRRDECLRTIAFTMPTGEATGALKACGEATSSSKKFLECTERATLFHDGPAAAIRACSVATDFSNYFDDCLHYASRIPHRADRVVAICHDRQASLDKSVARCVDHASRIGSQPAARVEACDASEQTRGGFERCLHRIAEP